MPQGGILSPADHADLVAVIDDYCDGDPALAEGDPHITTTDNVRYDFHGSGEFVLLKGYNEFEVQMRSRALATSFFPGPNALTEIASCTSSISALATRVGTDKVTYQPGLEGIPDPAGLQLRVNGTVKNVSSGGLILDGGGRITKTNNVLEVSYPGGEIMTVTPRFWSSQGHWNLNVSIDGAEANRGIMGRVHDDWLPALPNGNSLGSRPFSITQRKNQLFNIFANAWRVDSSDSLFDYAPGMSGTNFTVPDWPKDSGPCEVPDIDLVEPGNLTLANNACADIDDDTRRENCIFDVIVTGEPNIAQQFITSDRLQSNGTLTTVTYKAENPKTEQAAFLSAKVRLKRGGLKRTALGHIQFYNHGKPMGKPIRLDRNGQAFMKAPEFNSRTREAQITAQYFADKKQGHLPNMSNVLYLGTTN